MWFIVVDEFGHKRYINMDYVMDFYYDSNSTIIWLNGGGAIKVHKDVTKELMMSIRQMNVGVKQIGE